MRFRPWPILSVLDAAEVEPLFPEEPLRWLIPDGDFDFRVFRFSRSSVPFFHLQRGDSPSLTLCSIRIV